MKKGSTLGEVIRASNRMTAKMIYVPEKLRDFVKTEKTSSGTRLKG
jgi:hypothetical protein